MGSQRTELIEGIGNLLEVEMNRQLTEMGITLLHNPDPTSQEYCYYKDSKQHELTVDKQFRVFKIFMHSFYSYELGCTVGAHRMYFGISHLPTESLIKASNGLKGTKDI